jgi:hypothetical protein
MQMVMVHATIQMHFIAQNIGNGIYDSHLIYQTVPQAPELRGLDLLISKHRLNFGLTRAHGIRAKIR